jgi:DUF4097 and DUF4098 domain-containing protein YvlB
LTMKLDRGDVHITGADQNTIDIRVQRHVTRASDADAAKILREEDVEIKQTGNNILITAQQPPSLRRGWRHPNLEAHYEITVPRKFDAHVETAGGNLRVAGLNGGVNIQTSGGNLDCENILGQVDGRTSGGDIKAANVHGGVNIHTSGGNLNCENISGDLLGRTSGGNVNCENITGDVDGRTSGGSVYSRDCHSRLALETLGGNVTIDSFTGSELHARTQGGSVSADFVAAPKADSGLGTIGGDVKVRLPDNAALTLDAHTLGGFVKTDLPVQVQGKLSAGNLKGTVNGGGPLLKLETSGGNIEISKR